MSMSYVVKEDEDGSRYWLCVHENGEPEPLPRGFPLQFEPHFPAGTTLVLTLPEAEE